MPISGCTPATLVDTVRALRASLAKCEFGPRIRFVYNPLEYAWVPHRAYLERFGNGHKEVVLVGMNPGPWGMAQTGVPFGEISMVRDWMGISGAVAAPSVQHPRVPVTGFDCRRSEVSGRRLWGWARDRFGTADRFFSHFFVVNYCPLMFLDEQGRNTTPDKLPAANRALLLAICDEALAATVRRLVPRFVIGVGAFAEARVRSIVPACGTSVGGILHPSPASPAANRGWAQQAESQLRSLGFVLP
jgi:single-strand selective monofunctional uracil DNA glycosylase